MVTRFLLSEFGTSFATRGRGEELREEALKRVGASSALVVDLDTVEHMSYSFADEFLGKLSAEEDISVELTNLAPSISRTVEEAVRRRRSVAVSC
jgi:anti-anti-sigma regulatory factor